MKKIFLLLTLTLSTLVGMAQLPNWIIKPINDTVYVKIDNKLLQSNNGNQSTLWTMDGKELFNTDNIILPFKNGVATVIPKGKNTITGFVDSNGKYVTLPNPTIAYNNPYFENDYLLCKIGDEFVYYKKDGSKATLSEVVRAYPFHKGYAPYFTYENIKKKKDPYYGYHKANGQNIQYQIAADGDLKKIDPKEISFLSGIGNNGRGVAVIKNKLYWFMPDTENFEPLLWGNEESEKKRHLNLAENYDEFFLNLPTDSIIIKAKYGKNQIALLHFNKELLPTVFSFANEELNFEDKATAPFRYSQKLSAHGNKQKGYGLSLDSKAALPEQFEQVGLIYDNKAFVKLNDKWGVIEIIPNLNFNLRINKGEDVAFRHQKFDTQIRLDLPSGISAKDARIDIPDTTGCVIDKTSRESKDTESGNYVTYNCVLNIPKSLPDTITTLTYYPVTVSYDGVSLFKVPISIKAWHLKYYNVDPIESETSITNGIASFTLNINAQRNVGESDYPFEVKIEADSANIEYEKISETRYKCLVSNLQEGNNNLNIIVTEKGCPPSIFPFEIYYTKPAPKQKKKEEVVIRKKAPENKKQVTTPRLEI
ncbi:MAG: hypothetical protein HDS13_06800 [Bacteroides sp.]|nr:hypothetical protein [Bacteroides sp.]